MNKKIRFMKPVCERSCKRKYSARVNVFVQPICEH